MKTLIEQRDEFCKQQGVNHAVPAIRSMYPSLSRGEMAKQFEQVCSVGWDEGFKAGDELLEIAIEVLEYYQKAQCTWIDGSINIAPANSALTEIRKRRGEL